MFKVSTSLLKKSGWNLELELKDAIRDNLIVSLAESSMIRWIDNINGVSSGELYEEIRNIRKRIKYIKGQDGSNENAAEIKSLYSKLNELLLIREYLLVVVDNNKDYLRACEGFVVNGMHYKRLLSTTNGVKLSTIIFVSDYGTSGAVMREELFRRIENDRDKTKKFIPAKLEAYRALSCSSSLPVCDPEDVLVVPDVMTHFKGDYIYLDDNPDGVGPPLYEKILDGDCENNATDGFGLISPRLMEMWSAELGEPETASGMCIRMAFAKGMVFPFPIDEFALDVAGKYIVNDIWGNPHNMLHVDLILPESIVKLWDSYKSWDDYWQKSKKNGYSFSVTKVCEYKPKESRECNYQFLNCLDFTDEELEDLVAPTIDDISGVCGGNAAKAIIYLRGEDMTEASVRRGDNDWIQALMIDRHVLNDPYVRTKITQLIRRRIAKAKLGRIRVRGDFHVISFDPYLLCEHAFGIDGVGLLKAGEIFSWYWLNRGVGQVVAMRAPMTISNNIRKLKVVTSPEMEKWFRYMKNMLIINSWDQTAAAENGADADGDQMMTTDNHLLLNACNNPIVVQCTQKKGEKIIPTEESIIQSNILSFGDMIGQITNRATSLYDVRSMYPEDSEQFEEISRRLAFCQKYQQDCIDRAKGVVSAAMPTYFYREKEAAKRKQIDRDVCVSRKPYFMIYRYADISVEYQKYRRKADHDCRVQFKCTVNELLEKTPRTKEEETFISWYKNNSPVSLGDCTSNKICRMVEKYTDNISIHWAKESGKFDYTIYRNPTNTKHKEINFNAIDKIISRYEESLNTLTKYAKSRRMSNTEVEEYRRSLAEETKEECYCNCSSAADLCNIILDLTYGHGKPSQIPWDLCGDVMIHNLLSKNNNQISYYEKSPNGEVEYRGNRFTHKVCKIKEDEDAGLE